MECSRNMIFTLLQTLKKFSSSHNHKASSISFPNNLKTVNSIKNDIFHRSQVITEKLSQTLVVFTI